ncbi:hypothetical protein PHBOTO_003077 [Pseudozyma hubeiensis]|nr:hypothetical protein PHBOTO_003077 [Pseudozyma hubeiensis]
MSSPSSNRIHRAPIGFGPAPSPRQAPDGSRFDWSDARTTTVGVVLEADRDSLNAILPPGYTVDPTALHPTILFEVMQLRNLPWLAGRGYNTLGIYLNDVICSRVSPPVKASYLAVLFENFTDPISTGREELGFPKVFAEIPDASISRQGGEETRVHTLSWDGYEFLRLELSLADFAVEQSPALNPGKRPYTHPTKNGILHQRYVPAVGQPGKADADYATFCPPPPGSPSVLRFQTLRSDAGGVSAGCPALIDSNANKNNDGEHEFCAGKVKLQINRGTFEQLPTLYNVVDALAEIRIVALKEVALQQFKGASDLASNHRIEK